MMLRTTISTIRKVCSVGSVPRVIRDDFCNGPASYAVIRKTHKSTKSTDDGPDSTEQGTDFPILKTTSPDTTTGIPLTHRKKCQKIIEEAFGTRPAEPVKEQYCSHTVNIEATRREMKEAENEREKLQELHLKQENPMIPDDRQYSIFKMSRELIKIDDDVGETMVAENTTKKAPPKETAPRTVAVNNKDLVKVYDVASVKEPHLETDGYLKTQVSNAPFIQPKLDCVKEDLDTVGNKADLCDDADAETLSTVDRVKNVRNPAENSYHKQVLNVTTANEQDEKLAQKLETIEETPLVEAQKPGIEGFNVNPKVLGDQLNPTLTCKSIHKKQSNPEEGNLPGTYDEVAKRCLNHPLGQIDEMLVKEMETMGLPLTCNSENTTPSTLMGDEQLVQMDLFNETNQQEHQKIYPKSAELEDKDEERGNMMMSPSYHMFSQVRLPDLNEQAEEKTLLKSEDIEPGEIEDSVPKHPNPDQIKNKIKPVTCDNNPTSMLSCFRTASELHSNEEEMEGDQHISPSQLVNMSQTRQKDMNQTIQKHEQPQFVYSQPNVQLPAPNVITPTDKESMQGLHSSIYNELTGRYDEKNTEAENKTPHTAEPINPAINHPTNLSSYHPVGVGTGNIEVRNENKFYVNHLTGYAPSHKSDEVECHSRTPEFQPKTIEYQPKTLEEQAVLDERDAANILVERVPFTKITLPGQKFDTNKTMEKQAVLDERDATNILVERVPFTKITLPVQKFDRNIENSPNEDKVIEPCSNKLHSDVHSENLEPEKVTLPEELMKEHVLDPYYVLTCNETCPISTGPLSASKNTDFVDTSDTIYMKKNVFESIIPKARPNLNVPFEKVMAVRPKADVKSLMSQYENLTSDTKSQIIDKINISESVQPKLDGTHLVTPQCENVHADTQAQLHKISEKDFELIPENTPEITDLPNFKPKVLPEDPSLPSSQPVSLTELLKRVRERNRMQCTSDLGVQVDPTTGKCRRKAPRCPPGAPRPPPPPPSFGLPMLKKRPKVCLPIKKGGGSKKCAACDIDVTCGAQLGGNRPEIPCELDKGEACNAISRVDLTEVVLDRIQTLGKMVGVVLRQVKSNVETLLAREYGPWAPIPSWPLPKKAGNPCDKPCGNWTPGISGAPPCVRGCPVSPKASASMNPAPPCNLKPCEGFPKRRSFSALDCFVVTSEDNEVYDLGQF